MKIYDYNGKKNICGERIREARLKQRLSQSDLAARVQVEGVIMERDSISRVEIGTRFVPDYEIPIFAKVLGVSVLWLLGIEYPRRDFSSPGFMIHKKCVNYFLIAIDKYTSNVYNRQCKEGRT